MTLWGKNRSDLGKFKQGHKAAALSRGFSLIETAVAVGIIGFCCASLLGLLAMGMGTFHQATNITVESEIVQSISNDLKLDNFSTLISYASSPPTYYYDHEGVQLPDKTGSCYESAVSFSPVTASNSPANLDASGTTSVSAYAVTMTITNLTQQSASDLQHPHLYSLIIANNGL